ncbi:precorrin-6y C5,15-methyltransferase (decarboxylating) subunit CbiE [Streptomyces sp. TRM 70351]|uniref:precorrin-6y C5,15-methyltransferase (decarboxylating) subunit CbiE n=1 Tax=Streptomyces sp. TRM 70351 TaxID=3116552 RepID=UPI002E7ABACE|nr:precorrin-6y C5,15-methyltransferase (decarboxylating) subunit CbiE [Streptomyces sp. TRM 70351]MEE1929106.1 precorrin-6y C5,15-methyltransferase (decarboxylating) subunit CbiE [Streptomyces sp. TRM 70351]
MADRVTVIGWDGSPMDGAARAALGAATLVAGAAHHLALPEVPPGAEQVRLGSVPLAAQRIARHRGTAVVLADGDPGFFGVVRALRAPEHGLEVEVVPAVSAVAAAFARAGMPWDDAQIVVAHSRTLRRAVNVCRAHPKVAVLTAPGAGPAELALLLAGVHRTFVICEGLGTGRESMTVLTSDKAADHVWRDPNVVIVVGGHGAGAQSGTVQGSGWLAGRPPGYPGGRRGWALPAGPDAGPDGARRGERDGGPPREGSGARLTTGESAHLRAAQLARIGPRPGDLVWDIGTGAGTVAVEAAGFGAAVIAVDRNAEACARATAAARDAAVQLQVVHGGAPQVLEDLPEPDVVRVGGGGPRTVAACAERRPERIVTHATTRDEAEEAGRVLAEAGYRVECALLQTVELDTSQWRERDRTVVFLLCGTRV